MPPGKWGYYSVHRFNMSREEPPLDQLLPVELKLCILEKELERLESDLEILQQRRSELLEEIQNCNHILNTKRRRSILKRIK